MALRQIEKPAIPPLSLEDAYGILKLSAGGASTMLRQAQDEFLRRAINAATTSLDGPSGELGRCLLSQKWEFTFDSFGRGAIELPLPPVISVDEVAYLDRDGVGQVIPAEGYRFANLGSDDHAVMMPAAGFRWPNVSSEPGSCSVSMTCGYGTSSDDLPADLLMVLGARVATHYSSRESLAPSEYRPYRNSEIDDVIRRRRVRWVA